MARDFRPKDKSAKNKNKNKQKARESNADQAVAAGSSWSGQSNRKNHQHHSFNDDDNDDDDNDNDGDDDDQLMANIMAMGGTKDDLKLISGLGKPKAKKAESASASGSGRHKDGQRIQSDDQDESLSQDVKSFLSKLSSPKSSSPSQGRDEDHGEDQDPDQVGSQPSTSTSAPEKLKAKEKKKKEKEVAREDSVPSPGPGGKAEVSKKKGKEQQEQEPGGKGAEDSKKKRQEKAADAEKEEEKEQRRQERKSKQEKTKAISDKAEAEMNQEPLDGMGHGDWKSQRDSKALQQKTKNKNKNKGEEGEQEESSLRKVPAYGPNSAAAKKSKLEKQTLLVQPQPRWYDGLKGLRDLPLPDSFEPSSSSSSSKKTSKKSRKSGNQEGSQGKEVVEKISDEKISKLLSLGSQILQGENEKYFALTESGKGSASNGDGSIGTLSSSDAKFIRSLLSDAGAGSSGGGGGGGTVSDRSSALTLLLQSSPLHNLKALDALLAMSGKKSREEKSRAVRSLADWWSSKGGIGDLKLKYFSDQDNSTLVSIYEILERDPDSSSNPESKAKEVNVDSELVKNAKIRLCIFTFENVLKAKYFQFLQILEGISHDTLPFLRKQSLIHIMRLLKDSPEQESNLLRLLINKLGDTDKGVSAKASSLILDLLITHPGMKGVVVREIANLILKPVASSSKAIDGSERVENSSNHHARYYGLLTLNQTMLTNQDQDQIVATRLIELYFNMFDDLLRHDGLPSKDDSDKKTQDEEGQEAAEAGGKDSPAKKEKKRWRNDKNGGGKRGGKKGGKKKGREEMKKSPNALIGGEEMNSKMIAAILTGVRRAWPFANVQEGIFDKHISTLFNITHSGNFNISIQALQLIYQVSFSDDKRKDSADDISSSTNSIRDRFYRTLYSSLFDPRLETTSKQAMYLNLLFKSLKNDDDLNRKKSFVRRLIQVLNFMQPDFICGGLVLLGQLFKFDLNLRLMLTQSEEDEDEEIEIFNDVEVETDEEGNVKEVKRPTINSTSSLHETDPSKRSFKYDGKKREPKYSGAEKTCLWELLPLTKHFHPSVSLQANQLLNALPLTSNPDLTLNTLSHFLDRFVYRNPKKLSQKGNSAMQPMSNGPAGTNSASGGDPDTMVVRIKGQGIAKEEFANDEKFWRKKAGDVPVDQLFFHRYFNQKLQRQQSAADKKERVISRRRKGGADSDEAESEEEEDQDPDEVSLDSGSEMDMDGIESEPEPGSDQDSEGGGGGDDEENAPNGAESDIDQELDSDEDEEEKEIWKAMKNSMPHEKGDEDLMVDSDDDDGVDGENDDEDLAIYNYEDSDDEELEALKNQPTDGEEEEEDADADSDLDQPGVLGDLADFEEQEKGSSQGNQMQDSDSEGGEDVFEQEDEDDLLPFTSFVDDDDDEGYQTTTKKGKKRGLDEEEAEEGQDQSKSKNKERNRERREQKKRRKELPTFASADDYAHLLGASDDEE